MKTFAKDIVSHKNFIIDSENSLLTSIQPAENRVDDTVYLCEGFIDLQVNGYRGLDYSSDNLKEEDVVNIVSYLAEAGTVKHLPTIITGETNKTIRNIKTIISARKKDTVIEAAIPGIHLEGPYISSVDGARGAHDKKYVRLPDINELREWHEESEGLIKIITLAPELKGSSEFIKEAVKLGIKTSIGHSDSKTEDIKNAVDAGMSLSTHLGNGIYQMIDRRNNVIWEQLANNNLTAGIISDGFHLVPEQIEAFYRAKSLNNIFLVSDVGPLGGKKTGIYKWGNIDVQVYDDGHLGLPNTPYLAGAGHLQDTCIANFINVTGLSLKDALKTVIDIPNRILGIAKIVDDRKYDNGNLTLFKFEPGMEKIEVLETFINGKKVY
jgi:N-acetylglucosamine-6-phosphate deacetylase